MSRSSRILLPLFFMALATILGACASLPQNVEREPSHALADPTETSLGKQVAAEAGQHPGQSGFALVPSGRVAFTLRVGMADAAEKTLDLQYYIWEPDATGLMLAQRLLEAADRGVRVRLLLDDINLKDDASLAALDAHPNLEIRIFNPFAHRGMKSLDFVTDLGRVNHRMHNKVMIADNATAIAGGRNIGNHYFGVDTHANFRDLDIAAIGPIVPEISKSFDYFWNGRWSYPVAALAGTPATPEDLAGLRRRIEEFLASAAYPYPLDEDLDELAAAISSDTFTWAPGVAVYDDPETLAQINDGAVGEIAAALTSKVATIRRELLIESAYFVMPRGSIEGMRQLVDRGVAVRVLTNSLVSNDVLAAHAGYEKRRKELLEAGVELYELRPDSSRDALDQSALAGTSKAALHTKAFVFDRESLFIGSFNLDPRSANLNTEFGIYVESPELARQLGTFMDTGVAPDRAYHVVLDDHGRVRWIQTEPDGTIVRYDTEPHASLWQRFVANFLKLLPIESQL